MKKIFSQWFCRLPFSISWHQYQINALHDFLQGVLISKTLVPATTGRKSVSGTVKPRNGAKRAFRLYNNKRIKQENMAAVAISRFLRYAGINHLAYFR